MKIDDNNFEVTARSIKTAQTRRKNGTRPQAWYWAKVMKPQFAELEAGQTVVIETKAGRKVNLIPV